MQSIASSESPLIDLKDELRPFLLAYLEQHDIHPNTSGFINCINKEHDDHNPSMYTKNDFLHCFSCGASYDIFLAAHQLDDKPLRGKRFVFDNIFYLAEKFGISFDPESMAPDDETLDRWRYEDLYRDAALSLIEVSNYDLCKERNWTEEICKDWGIGTVGWEEFKLRLCHKGSYTPEELLERGINHKLFGSKLITHTIRNHKGQPNGFVARNTLYVRSDKTTWPKFRNTADHVPIYSKSKLLYGLDKIHNNRSGKLRILEGYGDAVSAYQYGSRRCCALGGTALTEHHIELLLELGITDIELCLDGDQTGKARMRSFLDRYCTIEGLRITVVLLDTNDIDWGTTAEDQRDPDNFLQRFSGEKFDNLKGISSFEWRLRDISEQGHNDHRDIARKMTPYIVAEQNAIERGLMCTLLASRTNIPIEDIREEVGRRCNQVIKDVGETLRGKLLRARDAIEIRSVIEEAQIKIEDTQDGKADDSFTRVEVVRALDDFFTTSEALTEDRKILGWDTGWPGFNDPVVMDGLPKKEVIITFAGPPNHGKSAVIINMVERLIHPDQGNKNLSTALWYLDDSRNVAFAKLLACMMKERVGDIMFPARNILKDPERSKRYKEWKEYLRNMVGNGTLHVKGHQIGNTFKDAENWVKHIQDKTGNDVVLFVDAAHDMMTGNPRYDQDERSRMIKVYSWFEEAVEKLSTTIITCAHITKAGMTRKPEQSDLLETGKIIFASKFIGIIYSELDQMASKGEREKASVYWEPKGLSDNLDGREPIIEMAVTKNKIQGWKGCKYFKTLSTRCHIEEMPIDVVRRLSKENRAKTRGVRIGESITNAAIDPEDIKLSLDFGN